MQHHGYVIIVNLGIVEIGCQIVYWAAFSFMMIINTHFDFVVLKVSFMRKMYIYTEELGNFLGLSYR